MNKVILLGRLTRDVEVKYTKSAEPVAVASFSIAVDRAYKREGGTDADFFNCKAFGKTAENISKFFGKGNKIAVVGRLENRSWTDDSGQKRYATDVVVEAFDFCENKASGEHSQPAPAPDNNSAPDCSLFQDDGADNGDLPF